jgi:hypothetical protein
MPELAHKKTADSADMDCRSSPDDPYYRLGPVHEYHYIRVRETGDWVVFLIEQAQPCSHKNRIEPAQPEFIFQSMRSWAGVAAVFSKNGIEPAQSELFFKIQVEPAQSGKIELEKNAFSTKFCRDRS